MFDDLDVSCPECGGTVRFNLDDVAMERTMTCSNGHGVKLRDEGGGAAEVSGALRDLDRQLDGLNRSINFKF